MQSVIMLWGLTIIVFGLLQLAPGSPADYLIPANITDPGQLHRIVAQMGLNRPVYVQYWHWFDGILHGNFGTAYSYGVPVTTLIGQNLLPTLQLQILVIVLSIAISIPIGVMAAVRRNRPFDHVVTTGTLFGLSMPNFWFALLLILLFSVKFRLLPAFGDDLQGSFLRSWSYFVLPAAVLSLALIPWYARFTRASMSESMQQDYIRTARASGLPERRIVFRDALKPALLPVVTVIGLSLPRLVGGSVIVESIFAWPGLGRLAYNSIQTQDAPVVMALALLTGAFVMIANLIVDIIYVALDPRVTYAH